ncbi:uncharacterized protein M8220_016341 [Acridotheres tristis]
MAFCPTCGQNFAKSNVIYWTKGGTWLHQKLEGICQDQRWLIKEFTEQHPAFCAYGQGHLRRVFRCADPESPEPAADSSLAPSAPAEESKEEQNDHKPPTGVTAQAEYSEPGQ